MKKVWEFVKQHAFFLLGGACIIIVGVIFIVSRESEAEITREGEVVYSAGANAGAISEENATGGGVGASAADTGAAENSGAGGGISEGNSDGGELGAGEALLPGITEISAVPETIYIGIHITGAVENPGFFELPPGARVNCAVERAGGATGAADLGRVNLAVFLRDEMKIIIPAEGEDIEEVFIFPDGSGGPGGATGGQPSGADGVQSGGGQPSGVHAGHSQPGITPCGLVNINTASLAELQTLTGVGPVIAQNIINFREAHGGFSSVDELIHVSRIGTVTLENLRASVTVSSS